MEHSCNIKTLWAWIGATLWPIILKALGGPHALLSSLCLFIPLDYFSSTHGKLRLAFLLVFNWNEAQSILRNFGLCGLTILEYVKQIVGQLKLKGGDKA